MLFNPWLMGVKIVHAFLKSIDPKWIVMARLEFELAYYDVEV